MRPVFDPAIKEALDEGREFVEELVGVAKYARDAVEDIFGPRQPQGARPPITRPPPPPGARPAFQGPEPVMVDYDLTENPPIPRATPQQPRVMDLGTARSLFELPENAPPELIKQRYSQLTWKGRDPERLEYINMAYELLLQDAVRRKHGK